LPAPERRSYDELENHFDKLSAAVEPDLLDPLTKQPFGFSGVLTHKDGVRWMFRRRSD
jgi:hypothetical protein